MRLLVLVFGVTFGLLVYSWASAYPGGFGTPSSPQPLQVNGEYAHWDLQIHNRGNPTQWDAQVDAQHTNTCGAPPGTHPVLAVAESVYICNNHVMTTGNAGGYGEIVMTPSQLLNCSAGCSVQWDMSTERMSQRDWPDVWLMPWDDNLTLPIEEFLPDLQGGPRRGIHVGAQAGQNSWAVSTYDNYQPTLMINQAWWRPMNEGIAAGVNQSATRQTFRLTVQAGGVKFERLASPTAPGLIWTHDVNWVPGFSPCNCLLASDYVVSFAQHTYNPEKDGSGVPATWHWFGTDSPQITPSAPFTLIHTSPALVTSQNALVTFDAPAPANAYLRFSGLCKVKIDGAIAPKQVYEGAPEHVSSYFIPIAQDKQSVVVSFEADDGYFGNPTPCHAKDFHVWAKAGGSPSTPTPNPTSIPPTATFTSVPSATPTPTVISPTATPAAPTATPTPTATLPTPTPTQPSNTTTCYSSQPSRSRVNGIWVVIGPEIAC